ncbi:hypothetical protein FSP39_025329 [Pinctada imbricata]|uniref:Uncharacterized protein n=1 Tax=Pinctada imbricata TaxID=66713 RepID=A0AA88Y5R5_PINIB|nr:hypothetical protein FSP39_025329 [Pinctada imbricata]
MHSIHTVAQAKEHWLNHGIDAGLQGIGSFHSKQYIARYDDLSAAFHSSYRQAINHYLTIGRGQEKRIGVLNHYENRWSINSNGITIGTSRRFGAAVESLTWNNKELVNSYDHGRQIQMACNSDPYTECYNPTEAGGRNDGISDTTHTHINWVRASGSVLETEVYPAFWLIPGSHEKRANLCQRGHPAMNHQATYSYPFHKKVVIGAHGINNVIQFDSNFTLGGDWPQDLNYIQMEAPATYLNWRQ